MWTGPWNFKEGFTVGGGLLAAGILLQIVAGPVDWEAFAFPVNIIVLCLYLAITGMMYALRRKVYAFKFSGAYASAVPVLFYTVGLTIVMGIIRQTGHEHPADILSGLHNMLSFWPFVMIYVWLSVIVSQVTIRRLLRFNRRDIPFLLNHAGLLITLLCATLGKADIRRYKMTIHLSSPEWRAADEEERIHELPIAIQLKDFTIDQYPPKLMLVDAKTGTPIPEKKPVTLLLDSAFKQGNLSGWNITLNKQLDESAPLMTRDTTNYLPWHSSGAVTAANITAVSGNGKTRKTGWVTCGSYQFPYQVLPLDDKMSIAMPEREPRRYASKLEIMTRSGKHESAEIEVNKPYTIDGWKIYQLSYNVEMGKWSDTSVVELVKDPWQPFVYTGIFMMMLGAVLMFLAPRRRKEAQS